MRVIVGLTVGTGVAEATDRGVAEGEGTASVPAGVWLAGPAVQPDSSHKRATKVQPHRLLMLVFVLTASPRSSRQRNGPCKGATAGRLRPGRGRRCPVESVGPL